MGVEILTGQGFWHALIWLAAALGVLLLSLALWSMGRREFRRGTEAELPFVSGECVEDPKVGAPHLYWGFAEALRPFLERLRNLHSGIIGDYVGWFAVILAVTLLLLMA